LDTYISKLKTIPIRTFCSKDGKKNAVVLMNLSVGR